MLSTACDGRTKKTMKIIDRYCQLSFSWTVVYQPESKARTNLLAADCQVQFRHKIYTRERAVSKFTGKSRGCFINRNYSDPPVKANMSWSKIGHLFSGLTIFQHLKRVWKHLFAWKETCDTLTTNHKADFGTDSSRTYRNS